MSKLQTALDEYLAVRRALGYKLPAQGYCCSSSSSSPSDPVLRTSRPSWH